MAGFVRLRVRGRAGTRVGLRHAEVLEPDGSLHVRALRGAKATDVYVLADDGETVLEPPFTFHGFRYAEVESDAELLDAEVIAISSNTPPRSTFECADARLNRLHANAAWSQRDNFVSVPTDCPQRDERLGWTGDVQAFAPTGSTLFGAEAFWRSWLRDLALEQDADLGVPSVVPNVVLEGPLRWDGRAGRTPPPSFRGPCTRRTATHRSSTISGRACTGWVDSLAARRGADDGSCRVDVLLKNRTIGEYFWKSTIDRMPPGIATRAKMGPIPARRGRRCCPTPARKSAGRNAP